MGCVGGGGSSDVYANVGARPGNRGNGKRVAERPSNVYANRDFESEATPCHSPEDPNTVIVTKRACRAAAVCLGLLCVLLLAGIIVLVVISIDNQSVCDEETDRLRTKLYNITEERDNIQTSYKVLSKALNVPKEVVCRPKWYQIASSCYYISTEKKTWNESRQDCLSRGSDLVVINSPQEQDKLVKRFKKRVWIGLTDIDVEGTWKWVDGTPLNRRFWDVQQPDNGGKTGEDCAEIYKIENPSAVWNDFPCGNTNFWICEIKI